MTPTITLRRATADDATALALVGAASFLETYAELIPGTDMIAHCREKHAAQVYAAWLADPTCAVWLAQTAVGAPVAYLVLIPASLPVEGPKPGDVEVLRIYALSRFHGEGLGYRLMAAAVAHAQALGAPRVVLGTHEGNAKALAFYARQGFGHIAGRRFTVGTSIFCDHVLAKDLLAR